MLQPGPALRTFFQWESQSCVEVVADLATEKAYFLPLESVKSYFTADDKLATILSEVFETEYPPIDSELVLRDHTAVFCILLRIGQGSYIEHFARYEELSDRRLPFDSSHPPAGFPDDEPDFLQRFCEEQWMYCVPTFDDYMLHKHFGRQRLLPITSKVPYGTEGFARKFVIKLYGPYNRLLPAGQRQQSKTSPTANTFVLKTYLMKEGKGPYSEETSGFRSVRHADSIIKFYGSYIHRDEFNVLLEFADKGSLEEYFQRESPPSQGADIIEFWEGLFQLIKGLKTIHSVREGHYDVKPENVLVLSNGEVSPSGWQFKFADFGLNNFRGRVSNHDGDANEMQDAPAYGAPECYMPYNPDKPTGRDSPMISWESDIWSLGCIYSEAAVWIAEGYKGLVDYRKKRMAETDRILFKGGDCFHDGVRVLQSVLDAHRDVEDSLRRSDYITSDVLHSMVGEMMWDEDRPNAKTLWRKAETVLSKARQKLSAKTGHEFPRPGGRGRSLPPLRVQPPTVPLPPLPPLSRGQRPRLTSITERAPPNAEKWRSQARVSQISGPGSDLPSPTFSDLQTISTESVSDFDRDLTDSVASWQMGDNNSMSSPTIPFTSPHASVQYDFQKHNSIEGRPRTLRSQGSYEPRSPPPALSSRMPYISNNEWPDKTSVAPTLSEHPPAYAPNTTFSTNGSEWNGGSVAGDPRIADETASIGRSASRASKASNQDSSNFFLREALAMEPPPEEAQTLESRKRPGFSLFPLRSRKDSSAVSNLGPLERTMTKYHDAVPDGVTPLPIHTQSMDYLSVNTCLEWKKAHKKVKKHAQVPPFPGAHLLKALNGRDHAFIVDDSASMRPIWSDMKRVFEALTYVVKGMSPDGTELFFTVNYDTYRRKDSSELCKLLDTNETIGNVRVPSGETDIANRLKLQLVAYCLKLHAAKYTPLPPKGKKDKTPRDIRRTNFYILTNGEWGQGPDPKIAIQTAADFLTAEKYPNGQISIQFISFASTAAAMQKINDVSKHDYGLDIVGSSSSKENVLKMLLGPLESLYAQGSDSGGSDRSDVASCRSTIISVAAAG